MIEVHLYGLLRKIVPDSIPCEDTILHLESIGTELFGDLLNRLSLTISDIGDCFINGRLANV